MRKKLISQALAIVGLALFPMVAQPQTWTNIKKLPPAGLSNCLLLTDGGVMCQSGPSWYKLTPDLSGSYLNGTWSTLASFPAGYNPDAYATAVLATGQLVVVGGEYNNGNFALTNMGAVYDPKANTWTMLTPPTTGSPNYFQCIGDAPSVVLADGRLLIGSKLYQNLAVLDPSALTWSIVSEIGKNDTFNSEEGWTLLPDGSVFTLDVSKAPAAERFLLSGATTGAWVSAGTTLQDLHTPTTSSPLQAPGCPVYDPPGEMGPALRRPDGTVFAIGASGYTGIYTPPAAGSTATGTWAIGAAMPSGLNVEDGPAALLPSGHVLFGGSPGDSDPGLKYFEFDGTNLVSVPAPARAAYDATYFTQLLVLPTGQVLFVDGSQDVQLYTPAASPSYNPAWAPTISAVNSTLINGGLYEIFGTQFNGLSAGTAFGDESQNATNYPLVRITNNATGHVFYAKTHDHSTMAIATGSAQVSTVFDMPANAEEGASTLQVVANGIPSAAASVTVAPTPLPAAVSLSPSSGYASSQVFTAVFSDPSGASAINAAFLLINKTVTAANGCYVEYYPSSNLLYLKNDAGTALSAGIYPGSLGTASNSQCTLAGTGSSYHVSGNNATLTLALSFANSAYNHSYLYASDQAGNNTGWVQKGTWGILQAPTVTGVSGTGAPFTAAFSDPNGAASVNAAFLLVNTSLAGANGCYVEYSQSTNLLSLKNDAGTSFAGSVTPGSSATVSNSHCTVYGTGSSYGTSGNTATLAVTVTLSNFSTTPNIYLWASDRNGTNTGWVEEPLP